jgi:predicted phosphodiesterase
LALAGHWHRNNIATSGELEMVTSGPVGYPLGDDPSGFRIIEFDDAGVRHRYLPLPT